ncbi:LysM peptidoglycan-binding domain-containing protein [Streptomyces acidicola]|uniref:LysM peptidoglycan-binding domain-containing protein n=1 Tax=Streptomyces acidicola TaxID=2596892 RepID=A0A5N8X4G1_9ACTN|nr:transglycosylase family protein [Streptomyces acidicola]MPY53365.1 LysM peptidoglycan-binding domain-containing protein [Streptomyces acidicola]
MLSGNGRHRRPRQAPALLVAAGVTGSAIAIPLLGATGASAADNTVWDSVAECESGGSWSADTGNGRFGGLQLTQGDWEEYGGLDYAVSPDLASRSQQIAVAQKILEDQGVGAWRTCGLLHGLTEESGSVSIDTGVAGDSSSDGSGSSGSSGLSKSPKVSESSDSSGSSGSRGSSGSSSESSPDPSSSPSASASADSSAKPGTPAGSDASASRSPDSSPIEDPEGDSDKSEQKVGSWSLVDTGAVDSGSVEAGAVDTGTGGAGAGGAGRHRGASADEAAVDSVKASSGRHAYTVRHGDTLESIADSLGLDGGWRALYDANRQAIGADADNIVPGRTLELPAE